MKRKYALDIDGERIEESNSAIALAKEAKRLIKAGFGREARVYVNRRPVDPTEECEFTFRSLEEE